MDVGAVFANFEYSDLQWAIPVFAGLLIIIGALLIGIIRGITSGVIIALLFGGVMSMAPSLVNLLQRDTSAVTRTSADVSESAARLALLNNDVLTEFGRLVTTIRATLDALEPIVTAESVTDRAAVGRFTEGLQSAEHRFDAAIDTLSLSARARDDLDRDLQAMQVEMRRANFRSRVELLRN